MTMHQEDNHSKDPAAIWRSALATFVSASVEALTAWLDREYLDRVEEVEESRHATVVVAEDDRLKDAAALLGVGVTSTVDEVRAAFRERIKREMQSGTFHDQGGEATDDHALHLIAAKNLLIEHAIGLEASNG